MKHFFYFTAMAVACVLGIASTASAQSQLITWEPAEQLFQGVGNETGPDAQSVVDNSGIFVLGINGTQVPAVPAPTTTVNGVVFTDVDAAGLIAGFTQNGVTVTASAGRDTTTAFQSGSITDPELSNLMIGGIFDAATYTFTDLTPGETYSIQIIANDARGNGGRNADWQVGFNDGVTPLASPAVPAAVAILNNRDVATAMGEQSGSIISGTFTAGPDGIQSFEFTGTRNSFMSDAANTGQINALQLSIVSTDCLLGDVNTSGAVDFADIAPFIGLLSTGTFQCEADVNESLTVDFADIAPFIGILAGA